MRCKSCNKILKENEIIWRPEQGQHEELCMSCRNIVFNLSEEDQIAVDLLDNKVNSLLDDDEVL